MRRYMNAATPVIDPMHVSQDDATKVLEKQAKAKPWSIADAEIIENFDLRPNAAFRAKARDMNFGSAVICPNKEEAGKLLRAIEEEYGDRTASCKTQPDGSIAVLRVAARALKTRAPRKQAGK